MGATEKIIMNARDVARSLDRMALQILERNYGVDALAIVGIHTRGVYLAERLRAIIAEREQIDVLTGSLDISLYRDDWSLATQNPTVRQTDIPFAVEENNIVLVDDVLFTGRTIRAALDAIMDFGRPRTIRLAVLVDRKCGRELPVQPDFTGMEINESVKEHVHVRLREKDGSDEVVMVNPGG